MHIVELLTESLDKQDAIHIIRKFVKFAQAELGLKSLPEIDMVTTVDFSESSMSFGQYGNGMIKVLMVNRHVTDVCRSLCHELVHYRQDLAGELDHNSGMDGSPAENEANAMAAVVMRKWGKKHPGLFRHSAIE